MLLLNFSHPITATQLDQITVLSGKSITRVIDMSPRFDEQHPFGPQLNKLLARTLLTREQWQNEHILIVLPSLNFISAYVVGRTAWTDGLFSAGGAHAAGAG